ncbi:MAG: hypothetical protein KIT84_06365 [Labilithrix sp.]|nr:hypothetical protein [Labilithrix sp.]MCW5810616.1 hypothetical protein [Labilithrix sp.]
MRVLVVLVVLAIGGCPSATPKATQTDAATPDASGTAVGSKDAGAAADTASDARAVLDAWQKAQNDGDFPAYEALYAARFEGVRRSGLQVARLDRARWMKERARMMKQKTEVGVRDLGLVSLSDGAELRFVQTWSSESYKDEGEKRIVLAREKGKLLIAREEMLRSITFAAGAPTPEKLMFVATNTEPPKRAPGAPLLVLTTALDDAWLKGPPRARWATGPAAVTERDVDPAKLPPEIRSWAGREVELFGPKGAACAGKVSGFLALGRVTPHFGTRARWTGTGDFQGEPPMAEPAVAAEAWSLAGKSGRVLTLVVSTPANEACRPALWGRATTGTKPVLVGSERADVATLALMRGELAKTKEYAAAQKDYDAMKEAKDPKRWEDFDSRIDARVFKTDKETLGTISIRAGNGCGSFGATLSAAFKIDGATLTPFRPPFGDTLEPASAGDVDGDGAADLVWAEGLLRGPAGATSEVHRLEIPFLDCGC